MPKRLRRESLPPEILERLAAVHAKTEDVQTQTLDEMIVNFCAEPLPEREIVVWEVIADMFERHAPEGPQLERQELFALFLETTMSPVTGNFKTIPEPRARELAEELQREWAARNERGRAPR